MIRIRIGFVKNQAMPLLAQVRPDLYAYCEQRAHTHDFVREVLNIYFQKPLNGFQFGGLDIARETLVGLEPLRQQFEHEYANPQKKRGDAGTKASDLNPRPMYTPPSQPVQQSPAPIQQMYQAPPPQPQAYQPPPPSTPAPKPIWNNVRGIWEIPEPEPVQQPPQPIWNPISRQWELPMEQPTRQVPPEYMSPVITVDRDEDDNDEEEEKEPVIVDLEAETVRMKDVEFDPAMFVPLQTGTQLDSYFSLTKGIMPATNIMVQGPAGSGKSSVLIDIACLLKKKDPEKRILYISGEMTKIDMKGLVDRFNGFEELDILFLNEYSEIDTRELLDKILSSGWDMVIMDSFNEILGSIIDTAIDPVNTKSGEKWMINQFLNHNQGGNEKNLPTVFFFIMQVGKDGKFVGSNRIKHAATAFMHIEFTKNQNLFIYFSKNRRGETYNNLYFEHHSKGIHYDFEKYNQDIQMREALKRAEIENKNSWSTILKANNDDANTTITVADPQVEILQAAVENFIPDEEETTEEVQSETVDTLSEEDEPTLEIPQAQIDLEDMIAEVETETSVTDEVDVETEENIKEEVKEEVEVDIEEETEEEEVKSGLSINLDDDEPEEKEEDKEEIVNKNIPEDNPNSTDFSSLVEL